MKTTTNMKTVLATLATLGLAACAEGKKSNDASTAGHDETPSDSTGATGDVRLGMGSSLALADETAPATLKVSDSLELTMARFNVAMIKLKATKEPSEEDKARETEANEDEAAEAKEQEQMALADQALAKPEDAGSGKPDGSGAQEEKGTVASRADRRAKVAAHCADLSAKMQAALDEEAAADKATRFKGPYVYDAIAKAFVGEEPDAVSVADGSYPRIELKMKRYCGTDATDPLVGNVFVLQGNWTKAEGEVVPFQVEWHNAVNFRLSGEGAFVVEPNAENHLVLAFDAAKWFEGVDLSTATVDATSGTILINNKDNHALMQTLRANVHKNMRFGKDGNGDGELQTTESAGASDETAAQPAEQ